VLGVATTGDKRIREMLDYVASVRLIGCAPNDSSLALATFRSVGTFLSTRAVARVHISWATTASLRRATVETLSP
jgi:hypothetical protein